MQMSAAKLNALVGETRIATGEEIVKAGAVAGYASPIGLKNALLIADEIVPVSQNLAAGANEAGFHFINTNFGRDYSAQIVADLAQAGADCECDQCGHPLLSGDAIRLSAHQSLHYKNILLALAESYRDEKGLAFPRSAAPFEVYLMHVPGKQMDTRAKSDEIYNELQNAGIRILYDDRDERAGVKFNDADLIGCPLRMTVGEKGLKEGMVELKPRKVKENQLVPVEKLLDYIKSVL
jgi:prolyl-tRNA synthetase